MNSCTSLTPQRQWALLAAIFLLAAIPRLGVVWSGFIPASGDTGGYVLPAKNLAAGLGYVDDAGRPYSARPPTYPIFLAVVFRIGGFSLHTVQIAQALLAAAGASALGLWIARRHGLRAGAATGILVALDPILIPVPAFVLSEALGTILVAASVVTMDHAIATRRSSYFVLAGLLGGAAALNTPITLLLIPWLLLTAWLSGSPHRPEWRAWALALGLTAACVGIWTARNYALRGDAVMVRDVGFGSLIWGMTVYPFDWIPTEHDPAFQSLYRNYQALVAENRDTQEHWLFLGLAWRNFRERPFLVFKQVMRANFWAWLEAPGSHLGERMRPVRWITLLFHQMQLIALAVALWVLGRKGQMREWALWISTIIYFAVFLSLMFPLPRYYVPLWPVVDTLIAVGLTHLAGRRDPLSSPAGIHPRALK